MDLIDRVVERIVGGCAQAATSSPNVGRVRILVLHRGHVVVGRVESESDREIVLRKASGVRKWGTTMGLGEIAIGGPTPKTVLDPCGTVRRHPLAVALSMDCEEARWSM